MSDAYTVLGIAATDKTLYALRGDGAVFVFFQRGATLPDGSIAEDPQWWHCPAVPGTIAAAHQAG
jgi:hypothetical protein